MSQQPITRVVVWIVHTDEDGNEYPGATWSTLEAPTPDNTAIAAISARVRQALPEFESNPDYEPPWTDQAPWNGS